MGGLVNQTVTGTMRYVPGVVASAGTASALYLANEGNAVPSSTRAANILTNTFVQSSALTISSWIYITKLPATSTSSMIWMFGTSTIEAFYLVADYVSATRANLRVAYSSVGNTATVPVTSDKWYHTVAVYIPSTSFSLYLDGALIGTNSTSVPASFSSGPGGNGNGFFALGDSTKTTSMQPFAGYIDDFRIYNRALGSGEIALLAGLTTGITSAPAGTSLAAYYPFDGSTAESSGNAGPALTTTGSVSYVTGPITGQAVYLANEGNVLATPTKAANRLTASYTHTNATTVSFWTYITKLPQLGQFSRLFSLGTTSTAYWDTSLIYLSGTTANLRADTSLSTANTIVTINTWYHVTVMHISSSLISIYINGSHISTVASSTGIVSGASFAIGDSVQTSTISPFAGYIDDFRIYNRALTSAEIAYLAGNAIYPSIQTFNQAAYFPFDGSLTDSSGNGVTLTPTGTMQYVTGVTGTQAIYFANEANTTAGTTALNYLTNTTLSISTMGTFSVSIWVLVTRIAPSGSMIIFSTNTTASAITNSVSIYINSNKFNSDFYGVSAAAGTTTIVTNTWYHVAISYSGTAISLYVNGAREGISSGTVASTTGFRISNSFSTYPGAFSGYIDDFRIYNTALTQSQISALYYGSAHIANQTTPYLGYVPSAAVLYQQSIEGNNVADLFYGTANTRPATLSLWLKNVTASTQTFTLALNNGGASNASRSALYSIASVAPNAWRRVVVNVPGDLLGTWLKDNGLGLNIALVLGANSGALSGTTGEWQTGAYFTADSNQNYAASATNFLALQDNAVYVTGVQLEKGALVTPFEFRPLQVELQLCQRYYEVLFASALGTGGGGYVGSTSTFAIVKRMVPSMFIIQTIRSNNIIVSYFDDKTVYGTLFVASSSATNTQLVLSAVIGMANAEL